MGDYLHSLPESGRQNLAAVGSSHSLAETVNLGTMTTAGLIGTLHNFCTPPVNFTYARQPKMAAATHNNGLYT